jgi:hypothetical protein
MFDRYSSRRISMAEVREMKKLRFSIFTKNITEAIERARKDEREICEKDKQEALEKQRQRIEGEWALETEELRGKLKSIELRMSQITDREKAVEKTRQELRRKALELRRIMSDLQYLSDRNKEENLERGQIIDRLLKEAEDVEDKLIGVDE